ncbi:MAG: alkaline phosphatase family protein [Alphaproteobacteria bacterium]
MRAGDLPAIASLRERGVHGRAISTDPPATFPAWTSFATASEPVEHGIFDFTLRRGYSIRFVSARDRARPSIWSRVAASGRRVAVYNLPASYPPEELPGGIFVSGFDTPVATAIDPSFVHPRGLHAELTRRHGPLVISDLNEVRIGDGWHEDALGVLLRDVARRGEIALDLLRREPWDLFFVLFGESDTAGHHFWWLHDARSPRHRPGALSGALREVYRAIDRAIGRLVDAMPSGARILLVSDHGMGGAGTRCVAPNRFLAERGWLRFAGAGAVDPALGALRGLALRAVPARLQGRLVRGPGAGIATRLEARSRFAGIDWPRTRAFSEELNYAPGVCLNVAGREPLGIVRPESAEETCRELVADLLAWRDPDTGAPIVARARPRREVHGEGPFLDRAPDVVVDLALEDGYSTTVRRSGGTSGPSVWRIGAGEHAGSKAAGMNGTHRSHGLYCWTADEAHPGQGPDRRLSEVGRLVLEALDVRASDSAEPASNAAEGIGELYGERESEVLERRMRALGYLE